MDIISALENCKKFNDCYGKLTVHKNSGWYSWEETIGSIVEEPEIELKHEKILRLLNKLGFIETSSGIFILKIDKKEIHVICKMTYNTTYGCQMGTFSYTVQDEKMDEI